jgi:hypothetical protein
METSVWIWTTAGWVAYTTTDVLCSGDYCPAGNVGRANVAAAIEGAPEGAVDYSGSGVTIEHRDPKGIDPYYEPRDVPEPVAVLVISGWYCSQTVYLRDGDDYAAEILGGLANYPLIDDEAHSRIEHERASETWGGMGTRDRIELCARFKVSIFAARRDDYPHDDQGGILDYLAGGS